MRFIALLIGFFALPLGAVTKPIKTLDELGIYTKETALKVATARVVLADYALIRRDFQQVAHLKRKEIDKWLLLHSGFMAESQVQKGVANNTNTAIATEPGIQIMAYRPPKYGRALVVQVEDALIDIKGAGATNPKNGSHSNGLGILPEMIREYMFEKLTNSVLKHHGAGDTIESYAVIDLGFSVNEQEVGWFRAAQILRQAHVRQTRCEKNHEWQIEQTLRKYGLSTAWDVQRPYVILNVQYSKERALVDFGCYFVSEKFLDPVVYQGYRKSKNPKLILNDPAGPDGIQPDPNLQVCFQKWNFGCFEDKFARPLIKSSSPKQFRIRCRKLAKYISSTLKEQQLLWQSPQHSIATEERPTKRLCLGALAEQAHEAFRDQE